MGKYIYKITNDINGKIYIGQTINVKRRFTEHCQRKDDSLIHNAIIKYGKEHFIIETLGFFEDYNEKEKYYINLFHSKTPLGYNMTDGGEEPPRMIGEANPNSKISAEVAEQIQKDLLNLNLPRKSIRKKYGISENILRHIIEGNSWRKEELSYPLRPPETIILEQKVERAKQLLRETNLSQKEIAKTLQVSRSFVTMVNIGQNHYDENEDYPIRKSPYNKNSNIEEIRKMIINTQIPLNQIAKKFQVSKQVVYDINRGNTYWQEKYTYPLRKPL